MQQNDQPSFIKKTEDAVYVASYFNPDLIHAIFQVFKKLLGNSLYADHDLQDVVYFLLYILGLSVVKLPKMIFKWLQSSHFLKRKGNQLVSLIQCLGVDTLRNHLKTVFTRRNKTGINILPERMLRPVLHAMYRCAAGHGTFESCHPTLTTFLANLILGITRITPIQSPDFTFFFDKVQDMSYKLINLTSLAKPSKVLAVQPLFAFGEEGFSVGLLKICP